MSRFFRHILFLIILASSSVLYSNEVEWVIRIKNSNGDIITDITELDFKNEVSNFAILRGVPDESIPVFITNDLERWQFATQIIEQEILYNKAVAEGYDKDEAVIEKAERERDKQIAQLYAREVLDDDILKVSEGEKRAYWNKERQRIEALAGGRAVTYAQVEKEIEYAIAQERMRGEYARIVKEANKKYKIKYSYKTDPAIVIEDYEVPLKYFEEMFNEALSQAGGNIPKEALSQAKASMFDSFVARELMTYEAKKSGFYETPQAKSLDHSIMRSAIVANYLEKTMKKDIVDSTDEEIENAYNQYGKTYNIDSLTYEEAAKALDLIVKESKFREQYQILLNDLRYSNSIEKRLELLDENN